MVSFIRRRWVSLPGLSTLEQNLFGTDKFLIKNDFYTTEMGQKFLNDLAPIYPERVLDISELIVNNLLK